MELKPGYKLTEVGVIPEDWGVQALSKLTNQIIDGTHLTPKYTNFGVPFLRVTDIQCSEIDFSELKFISQEEHQVLKNRCNPLKGDILLSKNGTIGISKIITWDWEFSIFVSLALLKLKSVKINSDYLDQFFKSDYLSEQIRQRSKQGTVTNLHLEEIRKFLIPLPPTKAEQTAIANALSDADALIQSLTSLIAKKRQIKQGAMQTLLNPHENGRLKDGWVMKKLGESCEMYSGGTPSTSVAAYYGGDIQWITSGDLNKGIITEVKGRITKIGLINSSAKTITRDTLLIALYGATSGVVAISKINAAINQAVLAIIPDESLKSVFLFYMLTYLKDWIIATYTQGGQPNLSGNILKSIEFYCPDVDEQTRIATTLSDMDTDIAALEAKLAKYRHIKQGMMQNLLTGRIRLVQPDSNTGAVA